MLSTADGTEVSSVPSCRSGATLQDIIAPIIVQRYKNAMQAVDRHDQLCVAFSLCSHHHFKKWYIKFMLALIVITITNASIHFFLANPHKKVFKIIG
jgi:hypothetical protein